MVPPIPASLALKGRLGTSHYLPVGMSGPIPFSVLISSLQKMLLGGVAVVNM